jgi:hypothetical protein
MKIALASPYDLAYPGTRWSRRHENQVSQGNPADIVFYRHVSPAELPRHHQPWDFKPCKPGTESTLARESSYLSKRETNC